MEMMKIWMSEVGLKAKTVINIEKIQDQSLEGGIAVTKIWTIVVVMLWWRTFGTIGVKSLGHTRRFCPKRGKSPKDQEHSNGDAVMVEEGYESSNVLLVAMNCTGKQRIVDLGSSFHMSLNRD